MEITPLFKTHFSIGKSILTIKSDVEDGSDSVIGIAKENNLKEVTIVEDSLEGFLSTIEACKKEGIKLNFGVRIPCVEDISEFDSSEKKFINSHKVVVMLKNITDESYSAFVRLFSKASRNPNALFTVVDFKFLKENWDDEHFELHIPFYDSFLHKNMMVDGCLFFPDLSSFPNVTFHEEDNGVVVDKILSGAVREFVGGDPKLKIKKCKTIYYKNKDDFEAYQTFKIITSRKANNGRSPTLEAPELEGCRSNRFCWEAYLEDVKNKSINITIAKDKINVDKFSKFLVFDFETESLNLRCKAWQCGFLLVDHAKTLKSEESWIWHDNINVSKGAAEVTQFTLEKYDRIGNPKNNPNGIKRINLDGSVSEQVAYYPKDWYEMFSEYLFDESVGIVFQNGLDFDVPILGSMQELMGYKTNFSFLRRCFDTKSIQIGITKKHKVDRVNFLEWQLKNNSVGRFAKGCSLKAMVKDYYKLGYDETRHHVEALYDCEMTRDVFYQQRKELRD